MLDPLAALLSDYALVLCGSRGESGMGSGLLPHSLAQRLGRPLLPNVLSAQLAGGAVRARQFLPGRRRDMEADLPALLTVHPAAPFEPRYAYAGARRARTARCGAAQAAPLADAWRIEPADARPQAGRARTRPAATGCWPRPPCQPGRRSHPARHPEDKARAVLAYLRTHNLVDY